MYFTDQIRQDIEDAVFRLKPWRAEDGSTLFNGWARMASPVVRFAVIQVKFTPLPILFII